MIGQSRNCATYDGFVLVACSLLTVMCAAAAAIVAVLDPSSLADTQAFYVLLSAAGVSFLSMWACTAVIAHRDQSLTPALVRINR